MNPNLLLFIKDIIYLREKMGHISKSWWALSSIGTHWIVIYVKNDVAIFFDSFEVEYIAKRIETLIGNKIIKANIHKIQA